MNHIEEQINDCVAGLEKQIQNIEEIGRMYRLTPAERKLVIVLRSMIDDLKTERQKQQELYKQYDIVGLPLKLRAERKNVPDIPNIPPPPLPKTPDPSTKLGDL